MWISNIIYYFEMFIIFYFIYINVIYLFLSIAAFFHIRKYMQQVSLVDYDESFIKQIYKPVSLH